MTWKVIIFLLLPIFNLKTWYTLYMCLSECVCERERVCVIEGNILGRIVLLKFASLIESFVIPNWRRTLPNTSFKSKKKSQSEFVGNKVDYAQMMLPLPIIYSNFLNDQPNFWQQLRGRLAHQNSCCLWRCRWCCCCCCFWSCCCCCCLWSCCCCCSSSGSCCCRCCSSSISCCCCCFWSCRWCWCCCCC